MLNKIKKIIYRNSYILRKNKIKTKDFFKNNNLIGGGKTLSVNYDNIVYMFEESEIDDNHFILYSNEKNPLDCVSIIISKEDKLAEIHGISNYDKCLQNSNTNVGSTLLKITIKMLKKYKDKFGISMITLTDNSIKKCGEENIILSKMLILLGGDTWYGKYGFRPYDIQVKSMNKKTNKEYEKNKKVIKKITITDVNIIKYIEMTKKDRLIKDVKKLLLVEPNMLVLIFYINLLKTMIKHVNILVCFMKSYLKI